LVDRDSVSRDFNVSDTLITSKDISSYLVSDAFEIVKNTEYEFEMIVNEMNALYVKITEVGTPLNTITISHGARYTVQSSGSDFGIGVDNSSGGL